MVEEEMAAAVAEALSDRLEILPRRCFLCSYVEIPPIVDKLTRR